jgi:hypothetical protein
MLSDSESNKYTHTPSWKRYLESRLSNEFARVGKKHNTAVGFLKLLHYVMHLGSVDLLALCPTLLCAESPWSGRLAASNSVGSSKSR